MTIVHSIVGTLVLLGYLVATILYFLNYSGRRISQARTVSMAAAGLLAIQIILGFILIGTGEENTSSHYAFAILAVIPVGFEHGYAARRTSLQQRNLLSAIATLVTFVLVLVTYLIGQDVIG
jgi:glycopeptide antibiotics resistance protein